LASTGEGPNSGKVGNQRGKIKSGRIKPELESVGEFGASACRSRDRAQNYLPPIAFFGRKGIQIACDWEAGFAQVHVPALSI